VRLARGVYAYRYHQHDIEADADEDDGCSAQIVILRCLSCMSVSEVTIEWRQVRMGPEHREAENGALVPA
jgi:hypothetical protein